MIICIYKIGDQHYGWKFTTDIGEVLIRVEDVYADVETLREDLAKVIKYLPTAKIQEQVE